MEDVVSDLQEQVRELQNRLQALGVIKDLSLASTIKDWNGDTKGGSVQEFFSQIETLGKISNWNDTDKALLAKTKMQGQALQFLQGNEELLKDLSCSEIEHLF